MLFQILKICQNFQSVSSLHSAGKIIEDIQEGQGGYFASE